MTAFPQTTLRRRPIRSGLLVPAVASALLAGAACGGAGTSDGDADAAGSHDDPEPVALVVSDPFAQADMAELSDASDAVMSGRVVDADAGLRLGDGGLRYTAFTVEVDEVLAGPPAGRVEVVLASHLADGRDVAVEGRPLPAVGDRGVWFLTTIAPEFGHDGYVLTGPAGQLLLEDDEVEGGGVPGESPVAVEVERLHSPEAVVDHVRSVAG